MNHLHRLGLASARHPWRTIVAWVLVIVAVGAAATTLGGALRDNWDVPGARAQKGLEQVREHFPAAGGSSAQVVLHDDRALDRRTVDAVTKELEGVDHVISVAPRLSQDGDTALLYLRYDVPTTDNAIMGKLGPLEKATEPALAAGYQVEFGGELPGTAGEIKGSGELIGILVALVLLVIAFGSVLAAGLPVVTAVAGLVVGSSLVAVLAGVMDVSATAPTIATMVGLGVGIDYALLMVTRYVDRLRAGDEPVEAAARATATAGKSVVGAGLTVLVSLMGLKMAALPTFDAFGYATAFAVASVMAAALTVVPALCALSGRRLLPRRERRAARAGVAITVTNAIGQKDPFTARWAMRVAEKPVAWGTLALVVMLALAAPALGMRTWPQDGGDEPKGTTVRSAHDLIAAEFGPGANGPLTVVVDRDRLGDAGVATVHQTIADLNGVATSAEPTVSQDGKLAVWDVEPTTAPSDPATTELLDELRSGILPDGVEITGFVPVLADISAMLADRLWLVVGFVVAVSVLLLTLMFRSVVVPLKAALMNLLSIGAAYGVMTLVFQHGVGLGLLGMDHTVAVSSWVPILMFAVLFGLSMDYEVFLVSAIHDDWLDTGDAQGSVVRGLASTGRVISMAAAIMVAVFLGFATEPGVVVKMLGVGMAVAVALDATVVRMVLVPATMTLLGRWNWWFPRLTRREVEPAEASVSTNTEELVNEGEPA